MSLCSVDIPNRVTATMSAERREVRVARGGGDPEQLIPELCRQFYGLGWVTGTGGGISMRGTAGGAERVWMAPSGVQKERIAAEDLFVLDEARAIVSSPPPERGLRMSQCAPLFWNSYELRDAGACIHTHSQHAVMATLATPGAEFVITHQEMIKGIARDSHPERAHLRYFDRLVVPIIENTPNERDLTDAMAAAIRAYPNSPAVLVRRHGVYVWGATWAKAKTMCECLDYLFEIAGRMRQHGMDPAEVPADSPYADLVEWSDPPGGRAPP